MERSSAASFASAMCLAFSKVVLPWVSDAESDADAVPWATVCRRALVPATFFGGRELERLGGRAKLAERIAVAVLASLRCRKALVRDCARVPATLAPCKIIIRGVKK